MKYILLVLFLLLSFKMYACETCLISDYNFTNYIAPEKLYCLLNKNSTITKEDLNGVIDQSSKKYRVSSLVILVKLEQEEGLVSGYHPERRYRAMGFASYYNYENSKKNKPRYFESWTEQVDLGTKLLRKYFDLWRPGLKILYKQNLGSVIADNACTYSLYEYIPCYTYYLNVDGSKSLGNILFERIFNRYYSIVYKSY